MKIKYFGKKIAGTVFAFSLLLGIGLATDLTAQAQYPNDQYRRNRDYRDQNQRRRNQDQDWRYNRGRNNDDGYPDYGGSFNLRQTALNAGANLGNKAGRNDREHNRRFEFRDENDYQRATKDYSSRLGDLGLYRMYFRLAFEHGYRDGYGGY